MNVEKVIVLKPDAVIANEGMFVWGGDTTKAALTRLEQAGGAGPVHRLLYQSPAEYHQEPLIAGQNIGKGREGPGAGRLL